MDGVGRLWSGSRYDCDHSGVLGAVGLHWGNRGDVGVASDIGGERGERRCALRRARKRGGEHQRPDSTWTEVVSEKVVGHPGLGRGWVVAGVSVADTDREQWNR